VRINSGGDVFAAQTIGNQLEQHPAAVTAKIDGLCASAATILLPSVFLVGEWQQRERQQHDQAAASERHRFLQGQRGGDRGHGGMD
jgi:conjugal transfer/entry exclusion protein